MKSLVPRLGFFLSFAFSIIASGLALAQQNPVHKDQVLAALNSVRTLTVNDVKVGEMVQYDHTILNAELQNFVFAQTQHEVLRRTDLGQNISFEIQTHMRDIESDGRARESWELETHNVSKNLSNALSSDLRDREYFNLSVESTTLEVPAAVKRRPNCGGLTSCSGIPATIISYEFKDDLTDGIFRVQVTASAVVPYLSTMMRICTSFKGVRSSWTQCNLVQDFNFGM